MQTPLRIALLIESSRAYGRGLLEGIASYVRNHGDWSVYHQERGMSDDAPAWFRQWSGDGVIARIESRSLLETLKKRRLPTIDLRGMHSLQGIPLIETNDRAVTELAVSHLLQRGHNTFAYCGFAGANFSQRRLNYFLPLVEAAGFNSYVYEGTPNPKSDVTSSIEGRGLLYEDSLADWITHLPKPAAVMACNDVRGQQVINACRELGIAVPDDVAVIGVDDDHLICELCDPPLSSVRPDTQRIGYAAAEMLAAMIEGNPPPAAKTFIDPVEVVTRRSTEVLALADREIARAVRFIRDSACQGITVADVLAAVSLSRSTLERRFQEMIGRSPRQQIVRVQIARAKQLLAETDFTLERIARLTGYKHIETLCVVFKRETGQTPGQFRAKQDVNSAAPLRRRTLPFGQE